MQVNNSLNQNFLSTNNLKPKNAEASFANELEKAQNSLEETKKLMWGINEDGSQTSFYKTNENNKYIVKTTDKNGTESQKIIDATKVDTTNASVDEMYVYALDLKESGKADFKDSVLKVAMAGAKQKIESEYKGAYSSDIKINFKELVSDIIAQSSSFWDEQNKTAWQEFLALL